MYSTHPKALYMDPPAKLRVCDPLSLPLSSTGPNEVSVQVHFSGINPADTKHAQYLGIHSHIIGYDFCGAVITSPPSSPYNPGDIVAGYTPSAHARPHRYGTLQPTLSCPEDMLFKVPPHLPEPDAAALPVVAMAAADALYNLFSAPLPSSPGEFWAPILIWGAGSSVGICAVQFARASGYKNIFVTASKSRHELLKGLGATHVFDYTLPTVVNDIVIAVEEAGKGNIIFALDAAGTYDSPSSADMMKEVVGEGDAVLVSVVLRDGKFKMPYSEMNLDWTIHLLGAPEPITIPARPADYQHAWKAMLWAAENYGSGFRLPSVEVFEGSAEEALREVEKVGNGERGFGKLVIRQPMK